MSCEPLGLILPNLSDYYGKLIHVSFCDLYLIFKVIVEFKLPNRRKSDLALAFEQVD